MTLLSTVAALFLLFQASATGTINGSVINSATGGAVAGAEVTLIDTNSPGTGYGIGGVITGVLSTVFLQGTRAPTARVAETSAPGRPGPVMVTTGADGRFSFKQVNAGTFRITVASTGFARQEYGQRTVNGPGTPINLTAGSTVQDLTIRLTPTGTVSGRISDELGQPAVDVPVQLVRVAFSPQGKTFQAVGSTNVNDRGEYRLYGISPGSYYLLAGNSPGPLGRPGRPSGLSTAVYALSFYPGVTDVSQAARIEVKSGSEVVADMRVQRENTYRVRGRVIDSRTGQAPPRADISLNYRNLTGGGGGFSSAQSYNPATGTFELRDVIPGQYIVQAQIQEANPPGPSTGAVDFAARQAAIAARPSAQVPVYVQNSDVDGVVLTLTVASPIPGRVSLQGAALSTLANLDRIRVEIRPTVDGIANPPTPTAVAADGTFRIDNLREGSYQIRIVNLPQGFYVKSAFLGGTDILTDVFKFSGSTSGTLDVVVSSGTAQVNGGVIDGRNRPVPNILAVLVPMQRNRADLYRIAETDQKGRFAMMGITPGDYKLFSWDGLEPFRYMDPDFISKFESNGTPVHVDESSTQSIQVKMIPAV